MLEQALLQWSLTKAEMKILSQESIAPNKLPLTQVHIHHLQLSKSSLSFFRLPNSYANQKKLHV